MNYFLHAARVPLNPGASIRCKAASSGQKAFRRLTLAGLKLPFCIPHTYDPQTCITLTVYLFVADLLQRPNRVGALKTIAILSPSFTLICNGQLCPSMVIIKGLVLLG